MNDSNEPCEREATWTLPLTGQQSLTISERRLLPNGNIEARVAISDHAGALVRQAIVVASPRDPLPHLGTDCLNVDLIVEQAVVRLLKDPRDYGRVLDEAIDSGPTVPPPAALDASTELMFRLLDYAHRAGHKEGCESGHLIGYGAGYRDGQADTVQGAERADRGGQQPQTVPTRALPFGREVTRGRI